MIGLIDYGAGNLRSVKKALDYLGAKSRILRTAEEFHGIEKVILPGVGAFQTAVERLRERGVFDKIKCWLKEDQPFLGICLGMQLLFERSEEAPDVAGFGVFHGEVRRFQHRKVPQIGWNQVRQAEACTALAGIEQNAFFYFLHGYYVAPASWDFVLGETDYGIRYPSIIQKGNVLAVQFHPEKSAKTGLRLLKNWIEP
ncbi:MAG: imidazole glycerol phosphate synthase subunit HisH [bacterium]